MLDQIYKQLTALQKQIDNLIKPEIMTVAELTALFLLRANNLSDVASAVTAFTNIKQDATETTTGVVERATQTEVNTGTDTTRYVSPATLANWSQRPVAENLLACSLTHDESWLLGTTLNDVADASHGPVLWRILNDANAPDVTGTAGGSTDPFTRCLTITLDGTTRVGAVQFVSAQRTRAYRGQVVSLSALLWATGITAVRMAVIVWTSTADTVTSDPVSAWAANPTLVANWAFIGTPADITISTTPGARKVVQNLTIPTNAVNLAVFIWTPSQEVSTDVLNVACVKLEPGIVATEFVSRDPGDELGLINRSYWKTFPILTTPATNAGTSGAMRWSAQAAGAVGQFSPSFSHPVRMRTASPTITIYNPSAANNEVRDSVAGDCSASAIAAGALNDHAYAVNCTGNLGTAVGNGLFFHVTVDNRL